jgi:outer membrane protein assembly factor BamB
VTTPWLRAALVLLLGCGGAPADDWPGWRGPTRDGHSAETDLPLKWSPTENVRWKTPLPDAGNSSPVVWKDRVFVTQALEKEARRAVLCFDRADGRLLWQKEVRFDGQEPTHATNPYCSATPVTDGERVIASHGSAGMVCYDFAGKELWRKDVGPMIHVWGNASSPILSGDLAILWCGPGERQVLLAVDKATGRTVWEHEEPGGNVGKDSKTWAGSWTTPIIVTVGDHDELILPVPERVKGFDPKTGRELWSCGSLGKLVYASPVVSADGVVVAMSGYGGPALAVRAGGSGDVTETHRLWRHTARIPQRVGSPVIVGGHAYLLSENGLAQCFELATGNDVWGKERISGASWGSFVAAGDRLYVTNQKGETLVLAAGPGFKELARNPLGERTLASPAVSNGEIFIRTYKHLWCIGGVKSSR